jgi:hypothetical protein
MPSVGVFAAIFNEHNHILLVKIKYGHKIGHYRVGIWILMNRR